MELGLMLTRLLFLALMLLLVPHASVAQESVAQENGAQEEDNIDTRLRTIETNIAQITGTLQKKHNSTKEIAELRFQLGQIEELLRTISGSNDNLDHDLEELSKLYQINRINFDTRLQAIEAILADGGISFPTSSVPQILGQIRTLKKVDAIPVDTATITTKVTDADDGDRASANRDAPLPLVGEAPIIDGNTPLDTNNPQILYDRGRADLTQGDYRNAQIKFSALIDKFPAHRLAGHAQYWLGETYYVRQNYKKAAEAFLTGYQKYAKNAKAPDNLLKLGMTLRQLGESKRGCDAFDEITVRFPNAPSAITQRAKIEKTRGGCR